MKLKVFLAVCAFVFVSAVHAENDHGGQGSTTTAPGATVGQQQQPVTKEQQLQQAVDACLAAQGVDPAIISSQADGQ